MKKVSAKLLGIKDKPFLVEHGAFETLSEAVSSAGSEAILVEKINKSLAGPKTQAQARAIIVAVVQEVTKVPFIMKKEKQEKDGKNVMVDVRDLAKDGDEAYVLRALSGNNAGKFDEVQALINAKVSEANLTNTLAAKVRGGHAVVKVAKTYKDRALTFLNGSKDINKFNAALEAIGMEKFTPIVGVPATDIANVEALARIVKAWSDYTS